MPKETGLWAEIREQLGCRRMPKSIGSRPLPEDVQKTSEKSALSAGCTVHRADELHQRFVQIPVKADII
jgi:hypothetical protein